MKAELIGGIEDGRIMDLVATPRVLRIPIHPMVTYASARPAGPVMEERLSELEYVLDNDSLLNLSSGETVKYRYSGRF